MDASAVEYPPFPTAEACVLPGESYTVFVEYFVGTSASLVPA